MPYNPLDFFKAGQEVGKSRKSVAGYATDNILNMFNKQLENEMLINQQKNLMQSFVGSQQGAQNTQGTQPGGFQPTKFGTKVGGVDVTWENPEAEVQQKMALERGTKIAESNIKRETLKKDLETFFAVDESIPRGQGMRRFSEGFKSLAEGVPQTTQRGIATGMHDAAVKRLRVQLVRAAGDVGNINVVEQKAAEEMIPKIFDSHELANLKRTYLRQLATAIDSNDPNQVKAIINSYMEEPNSPVSGLQAQNPLQQSAMQSQTEDKRTMYNQLREQGYSQEEVKRRLGY